MKTPDPRYYADLEAAKAALEAEGFEPVEVPDLPGGTAVMCRAGMCVEIFPADRGVRALFVAPTYVPEGRRHDD